jgi:hypothetical protein
VDEASVVVRTREVDEEANSSALEDEVVSKGTTTTMLVGVVVELEADEDSAGRITTSLNATAMHLSTSSLTGRCWRRSISTVWRN